MFGWAVFTTGINVKEERCMDMNCKNRLKMLKFISEYLRHIIPGTKVDTLGGTKWVL